MANSINLSGLKIGKDEDGITAGLTVVSTPTSITLTSSGADSGVVVFTPIVPMTPNELVAEGSMLKSKNGTTPFGAITSGDLRTLLAVNNVENVRVVDMDVSYKTTIELGKKQDILTTSNKISTAVVDGLDSKIALLATKADLATVSANAGLGIKKEFNSVVEMNAFTSSADGDQCAVNEGGGKRSVYIWKLLPTPAWNYVFSLADTHNHDDRYFTKTETTTALTSKLDKTATIAQTQVAGLDTSLAGKVDNSKVLTAVPPNAVFTDEKWAGAEQMRSDFNSLKTVVDNSAVSDVYRRTIKTFSGTWVQIAPNVLYRIDSDGDGSATRFVNFVKEGKVRVQRETDFPFTDTLRYGTSYLYDEDIKSNAFGYITWSGVSNWRDMDGDKYSYVTEYMRVEWERGNERMTKVIKLEINCNELNDKRRTYTINTTVYGDQFKQA